MKINLINLIDLISKKAPISKLGLGNYLSQLEIRIIRNSILLLSSFLFLLLPLLTSSYLEYLIYILSIRNYGVMI